MIRTHKILLADAVAKAQRRAEQIGTTLDPDLSNHDDETLHNAVRHFTVTEQLNMLNKFLDN